MVPLQLLLLLLVLAQIVRRCPSLQIGLVQFGHENRHEIQQMTEKPGAMRSMVSRIGGWFRGSF